MSCCRSAFSSPSSETSIVVRNLERVLVHYTHDPLAAARVSTGRCSSWHTGTGTGITGSFGSHFTDFKYRRVRCSALARVAASAGDRRSRVPLDGRSGLRRSRSALLIVSGSGSGRSRGRALPTGRRDVRMCRFLVEPRNERHRALSSNKFSNVMRAFITANNLQRNVLQQIKVPRMGRGDKRGALRVRII